MKKCGKTKDIIADKSTSGFKHPQLFEVNLFRMGAEGGVSRDLHPRTRGWIHEALLS